MTTHKNTAGIVERLEAAADLCSDCPPIGYPTDKTRRTQSPAPQSADDGEGELILRLRRQAVEWSAFSAQSLSLTNKEHYAQVAQSCREAASILERRSRALSPAQDTGGVVEAVKLRLREHYLTGIHCDHERKTDRASCSCSIWRGEEKPSIDAAVKDWIEHAVPIFSSTPSKPAPVGVQTGEVAGGFSAETIRKALCAGIEFHQSLMSDWAAPRRETPRTMRESDKFRDAYMPLWPEVMSSTTQSRAPVAADSEELRAVWRAALDDVGCAECRNIGYDPEEVFLLAMSRLRSQEGRK